MTGKFFEPKTTFEMDGLLTQEDIDNRHFVMKPCIKCFNYTKQDIREANRPCSYCGGDMSVASTYWMSLRTFKPRKFSESDKKKMGL